jgi:hypothetical protein
MPFAAKATIVAIIASLAVLNGLNKQPTEEEIILNKLAHCGLDGDRLDDYQKDELVNMTQVELYIVCERSLRTQELLKQQQDLMNNLKSININN